MHSCTHLLPPNACIIVILYGNFIKNASLYRIFLRILINYRNFVRKFSEFVQKSQM